MFFILAVPLGIFNTIRIDKQTNANITKQVNQRLEVLNNIENRLQDVKNEQQMQQLIAQLNRGNAPIIENQEQLRLASSNINEFIQTSRERINTEVGRRKKQIRSGLLKRSVKWNIGSLVSGLLFVYAWVMTKWARVKESLSEV